MVDPREILRQLASPATDREAAEALMAQLDGREAESVLEAFRWLHNATEETHLHAATMLLARWADRPVAEALAPALQALLDEPDAGDINKLAAADLLACYGEPVDPEELQARLRDPAELARAALATVLAAVDREPLALVRFLDALAQEPESLVMALIEDLVGLEEVPAAAAAGVLAPLAQSANADIAISAMAAIEALALTPAAAALMVVAAAHPDATVREQADRSLSRLPMRTPRPAGATVAQAWLSAPGGDEGRFVVLARSAPEGGVSGVLTLYLTPAGGIVRYGALDLVTRSDLDGLLQKMAVAGQPAEVVPPGVAAWYLEAATARTLSAGASASVGYAAWPWVLGPVAPIRPATESA